MKQWGGMTNEERALKARLKDEIRTFIPVWIFLCRGDVTKAHLVLRCCNNIIDRIIERMMEDRRNG